VLRFKTEKKVICSLQRSERDDETSKYCAMLSIVNEFQSVKASKIPNNP
jgi:hypothetical protein